MNSETVKELVERLTRIESEQKLLAEDKKHLIADFVEVLQRSMCNFTDQHMKMNIYTSVQ